MAKNHNQKAKTVVPDGKGGRSHKKEQQSKRTSTTIKRRKMTPLMVKLADLSSRQRDSYGCNQHVKAVIKTVLVAVKGENETGEDGVVTYPLAPLNGMRGKTAFARGMYTRQCVDVIKLPQPEREKLETDKDDYEARQIERTFVDFRAYMKLHKKRTKAQKAAMKAAAERKAGLAGA